MGPQVSKRGRGFERKVICCASGGRLWNRRGTNVGQHRAFGALKENATDLVSVLLTLPTCLTLR
jgi:hypothetical protein